MLAVNSLVLLHIFSRQKDAPDSKAVEDPHDQDGKLAQ